MIQVHACLADSRPVLTTSSKNVVCSMYSFAHWDEMKKFSAINVKKRILLKLPQIEIEKLLPKLHLFSQIFFRPMCLDWKNK